MTRDALQSRRAWVATLALTTGMTFAATAGCETVGSSERSTAASPQEGELPSGTKAEHTGLAQRSRSPQQDPEAAASSSAPAVGSDDTGARRAEAGGAPAEEPAGQAQAEVSAEAPANPRPAMRRRRVAHRKSGSGYGVGGFAMRGRGQGGGGSAGSRVRGIPARGESPAARPNREGYDHDEPTPFVSVSDEPLSTFSADVDTASYSNVRRFLNEGRLPPPSAVRVEEMLNYFRYAYPEPEDGPFGIHTEVAAAPWADGHQLVHIGLRTADIPVHDLPARNLVFLLDVSGSMASANKLPLLRRAMSLLVDQMLPKDRVAIVVYAGASGVVLPSTSGNRRHAILSALEQLRAGGSTNGGAGIELAYRIAEEHRVPGGINRVILATDGDFNVGVSSRGELARLIEKKRKTGTYLTVLGFGTGNIQDGTMEMLADKGNGNYAYIDSIAEARKVLVSEAGATLATVADDVKLQVEFNPEAVSSYRLIGYENRRLAARDFNDDTKDAGEVGAGHMVTALYEIVPAGVRGSGSESQVDPLRYQSERDRTAAATTDELMLLKLRYKTPGETKSKLITRPIHKAARETPSREMRFATAVAGFGMWLRHDPHWDSPGLSKLGAMARDATGDSRDRMELVRLMRRAAQLSDR